VAAELDENLVRRHYAKKSDLMRRRKKDAENPTATFHSPKSNDKAPSFG
jgi:hypothetical protein